MMVPNERLHQSGLCVLQSQQRLFPGKSSTGMTLGAIISLARLDIRRDISMRLRQPEPYS